MSLIEDDYIEEGFVKKNKKTNSKKKKVIIHVTGGIAYVYDCPKDVDVEIIDFDNINFIED